MKDEIFIKRVLTLITDLIDSLPTDCNYVDEELRNVFSHIDSLILCGMDYAREREPVTTGERSAVMSANVGQSNYAQKALQPWDIWTEYGLNPWDADIVKRILRTKTEEGMAPKDSRILDYEKIKHICDKRIEDISNGDKFYQQTKIPAWVVE